MNLIELVNMSRYNKLNVDDIFAILCEDDHLTLDDSATEEEGDEENCVQNVENNDENSCDSEDTQVNSCTEEDVETADVPVPFNSERVYRISNKYIISQNKSNKYSSCISGSIKHIQKYI